MKELETYEVTKDDSCRRAMRLYQQALSNPVMRMINSAAFLGNMRNVVYSLENAGKLDVIQYDFSSPDKVHISESKNCIINDYDEMIYTKHPIHGDSYVCRLDDLYQLNNSMRVFIIGLNDDNMVDIKLIAELTWKWLDTYLGEVWHMDRRHQWNENPWNMVPYYVVHMAKAMFAHPASYMQNLTDMSAAWRLVNHKAARDALREKYETIRILDEMSGGTKIPA